MTVAFASGFGSVRRFNGQIRRTYKRTPTEFYGSDEWKTGPREATLADIDSYTTVVVRLDDVAIKGLRALPSRAEPR